MKLVITDLDRTLLREDRSISDYMVGVFEKCREKGILVGFASSRAESAMTRFIDAIHPDVIISNGGATISVNGEIIHRSLISSQDVKTILKMCTDFTGGKGGITLDSEVGYYCNFIPTDPDRGATAKYSDFKDFDVPCYKITPELEKEEWAKQIIEKCPDCFVVNYSGENWRKFSPKGSDKGSALKILANYLNIELSQTVAFGDDWNDFEMLTVAGTGVAMGNAIDEVKTIADCITDTNDNDGVAKWLEVNI